MPDSRPRASKSPGNIEPLATLPIFLKLAGRRVLVAGGTPSAVWKAELLAAAGAAVTVAAAEPCDEMEELEEAMPDHLTLQRSGWTPADLDGAAVAIGAFEGDEGQAFRDAARAAGVPVNVIDVPPLCDFQFGTIVARSPLVIGISTDGAAPVFGQALRARIEALLPAEIGAWALAAKNWRAPLQARRLSFAARRRFWELFADLALEGGDRAPREEDRLRCMAAAEGAEAVRDGRIILVGAGPGRVDQVTLAAVRALQSADVILHEPGLEASIVGLGRREARRVAAPSETATAVAIARSHSEIGLTVAWIAPGDPETCPSWSARSSGFQGLATTLETVRGLRCDTCPHGCAALPPGPVAIQ